MKGRVLVVAGSDSGAGAGIQADIKTVMALGGYATTAITALTAQDTLGIHEVMPVPPAFVARQMTLVLDDIGADCVKAGMLGDAAVIEAVAAVLEAKARDVPLVLDPVMTAKGGAALLARAAEGALKTLLLPRAALLTPNVPEAEALTGLAIADLDGMRRAADRLLAAGARAVLVKGGHLPGDVVRDLYAAPGGAVEVIDGPRIATRHSHGTGCTLASAIATGLAQGLAPLAAIRRARAYLTEALRNAPGLGRGHGPLGHGYGIG
ncbi:MAG TPA: bifunctional hydroxymethylpyrimidine kinase/phosphomethylpyrimidine kinase [Stellaceae bacterium]|nr:bifunctional hydroxymethylpyrimidine kinase/phosphomethylpyrimidine kinase [Stellaceae bacterium]